MGPIPPNSTAAVLVLFSLCLLVTFYTLLGKSQKIAKTNF
jgi:hypothetical protein